MVEHWLDVALREHRRLNLGGHYNVPRIPAETVALLVELKNKLSGTNRTVFEENAIAEETVNPDF